MQAILNVIDVSRVMQWATQRNDDFYSVPLPLRRALDRMIDEVIEEGVGADRLRRLPDGKTLSAWWDGSYIRWWVCSATNSATLYRGYVSIYHNDNSFVEVA